MSILIIAEEHPSSFSAITPALVSAGCQLDKDIHVLVVGEHHAALAQQAAAISGVTRVLEAPQAIYARGAAENNAALIADLASQYSPILASTTTRGKNILPRAAGLLNCAPISDVIAIESIDTFIRPIYAGNARATVQCLSPIKFMTVRASSFVKAPEGTDVAPIIPVTAAFDLKLSEWINCESVPSERPELGSARVVISGGRGLGSAENFQLLSGIANLLHAALGASRAAVDAGFVPNDYQVGQTGKIVAPDLYIAVGISGAIQHLAGMKDSKVIVAINKDPDAPIFQVADYGWVGDLFEILPQLESELKKIL